MIKIPRLKNNFKLNLPLAIYGDVIGERKDYWLLQKIQVHFSLNY